MAFDIIIKSGTVIDGTGSPRVAADVGITDGLITAVGALDGDAAHTINAEGLIVAPGFIDIHSHSEFILPLDNAADILSPFIHQGITTLITGNCGYSPAPVNPATLDLLKSYTMFLKGEELGWEWQTFGEYLDQLERRGVCLNMVPMVAHGAVRIHEVGFEGRPVTPDEMFSMQRLVSQALDDGAFGLSSGLLYAPGIFAPPEEIIELASALTGQDAIYTSHIRGSSETLLSATKEVIRVGEANQIPCQHSHIEAFGHDHWPKIERILALHESAHDRGVDTGFDVIPYVAANTTLLAIYPPWALTGGVDALLDRLRNADLRRDIRKSIEEDLPGWPSWLEGDWPHNLVEATGWDNIWVIWTESGDNQHMEGRSFAAIADEQGRDPFDVAFDLTLAEGGHAMCLYIGVSGDLQTEDGLETLLAHPWAAVETDAIITGKGVPHPAGYGAFPRVLGHFSRDRGLFSLEEAVHKMTGIAAERFGLKRRGRLQEGMAADITVFDATTVADTTTYTEPTSSPQGIEYVLINGELAVDAGTLVTAGKSGRVIRRGASDA